MKILVTGKNGKVVRGFCGYIEENYKNIHVDCLSLRGDEWKNTNLSEYDYVYHCVGAVKGDKESLYAINRDLTRDFAVKAKKDGVKNFIYLSSMAVYDLSANVSNKTVTREYPVLLPEESHNNYGASKLAGEEELLKLADEDFRVHIIRAPSIYGRNTERYFDGYFRFMKAGIFADAFHVWKRSIIYIDNLSELVLCICRKDASNPVEYYYPQNKEMLSVSEIVKEIALAKSKKMRFIRLPKFAEKIISKMQPIGSVFAPIMYSKETSDVFDFKYCVVTASDSIKRTLSE